MSESEPASTCTASYGWEDFDISKLAEGCRCPVKDCSEQVTPYPRKSAQVCSRHGLRLHKNTFAYFNGFSRDERIAASLRNFHFRQDYVREHVIFSGDKAETHRLGHEMSEDAVSWNVFVGLQEAGMLRAVTMFLTGRAVDRDPELYLWGARVGGGAPSIYPALAAARDKLEKDIRKYRTEPDIMLVIPEKLVVCVEAKFGSANTLASSGATKNDEKPHDVPGLIARYLDAASPCAQSAIDRASIGPKLHSQLFRNVVFATEMAQGRDWHVVNLVSATQWKGRPNSATASFTDPCEDVRRYLASTFKECFSFRTWEALYRELVSKQGRASAVSTYLSSKSAHYRAAFELA